MFVMKVHLFCSHTPTEQRKCGGTICSLISHFRAVISFVYQTKQATPSLMYVYVGVGKKYLRAIKYWTQIHLYRKNVTVWSLFIIACLLFWEVPNWLIISAWIWPYCCYPNKDHLDKPRIRQRWLWKFWSTVIERFQIAELAFFARTIYK